MKTLIRISKLLSTTYNHVDSSAFHSSSLSSVFLFKINFCRSKGISNTIYLLCVEKCFLENISIFRIPPSEFMISIRHEKTFLLFRRGAWHFGFYSECFARKKRISICRNANNMYVLCFCLE